MTGDNDWFRLKKAKIQTRFRHVYIGDLTLIFALPSF